MGLLKNSATANTMVSLCGLCSGDRNPIVHLHTCIYRSPLP